MFKLSFVGNVAATMCPGTGVRDYQDVPILIILCLAQYNCNHVNIQKVQREDGQSSRCKFEVNSKVGFYEAIMGDIPGMGTTWSKAHKYMI